MKTETMHCGTFSPHVLHGRLPCTTPNSRASRAALQARWMTLTKLARPPCRAAGFRGKAIIARKPSPAQNFSTCPERERKIALWRRRSNLQLLAPAPAYPAAMLAQMTHGIARALSDGQTESQGEYEAKSILLTGGAGFIASHVVIRLVQRYPEAKVVVLDKLDYCASINNLDAVKDCPNFELVKGDIQSADLIGHLLTQHNIDTVMHFAAQTHVDNSFGNSLAFTMNNTYGTHVLLEACRVYGGVRRFVAVSTDEVYGETSVGKESGCTETSTLEPTNPYSAAKAGAEMMVKAYMTSYKLPCIITRGNNVYGPHQFPEKLVPKFTLLARRGEALPVHGAGQSTRSYLYVEDVAEAFEVILRKGAVGETYNIGTQKERTVMDVAHSIAKHFSLPMDNIVHVRDRAFNDQRYYICDKKLAALGWTEKTSWETGLKKTIDWYLEHGFESRWVGDVERALAAHPKAQ